MNYFDLKYKGLFSFTAILMVSLLTLWGCPKKTEVTASPTEQKEVQNEAVTAPSTPAPAAETAPAATKTETVANEGKERAAAATEGLKPVYFDFDKSFIRTDARDTMQANAAWLLAHPKENIRIEGNCDERGTIEYNQALGQRRAASAKRYLTDMGVSAGHITLLSFGKEKPICTEHTESCWQQNRRDDFTVVGQ